MIVICSKPGYLGNRMVIFSHVIYSVVKFESKHSIYNLAFDNYLHFFNFGQNNFSRFPASTSKIQLSWIIKRIMYRLAYHFSQFLEFSRINIPFIKVINLDFNKELYLDSIEFQKILNKNRIIFLKGFWFKSHLEEELLETNISKFFAVNPKYKTTFTKDEDNIRIGIHLRRRDYVNMLGGKFFYSFEEYNSFLLQISTFFEGKKILFCLVSDEKLESAYFDTNLDIEILQGSIIEDMQTLASCDFIFGPPSTFSLAASLMGNKPLQFLESVNLETFKPKIFPYSEFNRIMYYEFVDTYNKLK